MKTRRTKASVREPLPVPQAEAPVEQPAPPAPAPTVGVCQSCGEPAAHAVMVLGKPMELCIACTPPDALPVRWQLLHADCLAALRAMPDASFDACLCDSPYGLGPREPTAEEIAAYVLGTADMDTGGDFMGRKWKIPSVAIWREVLRVLKPGAPLLTFTGSRTHDLLTIGLRAAGFEIGDTIEWCYGQGMPKPATKTDMYIDDALGLKDQRPVVGSRELTGNAAVPTKQKGGTYGIQVGTVEAKTVPITAPASPEAALWEGYGHALSPCHEPITLAYKPFDGTIAHNCMTHGVGGLNLPACRIECSGRALKEKPAGGDALNVLGDGLNGSAYIVGSTDLGRWPGNVILSHGAGCRPVGTRQVKTGTAVKRHGVSVDTPSWGGDRLGAYPEGTPDAGYGTDGKETVEAWECEPGCPSALIDAQSGDRPATLTGRADPTKSHANPQDNAGKSTFGGGNSAVYADSGGASRYFKHVAGLWADWPIDVEILGQKAASLLYQGKVTRGERELGCEALPLRSAAECTNREEGTLGTDRPQSGAGRGSGARNHGPCLKPIALIKYLATLVLPPTRPTGKRRILVPFAGTGSEMIGSLRAGWDEVVGIERDEQYVTIAQARIPRWEQVRPDIDEAETIRLANAAAAQQDRRQQALF
jgi:DNA modification methylase